MNKNTEEKKEKQEEREKAITLSEQEYNQLKQEVEKSRQAQERILRIQADFENLRKRLEREKVEFMRFANEGLIGELLNVVDDLGRTLESAQEKHEDFSAFLKGVEMILAHLYDLLKKHGLLPIEAKGKAFDPCFHEALLKMETDDFPENTVVEELQKGYLLNNRVIRTSKVKVSKRSANKGKVGSSE
jgi:molecular chaperone GrpE